MARKKGHAEVGGLTTRELRILLRQDGVLRLGESAVRKLASGGFRGDQADLQWLYDCAMEPGNSEGRLKGNPRSLCFTQAGTCTLGIVCDVKFDAGALPGHVRDKAARGEAVWPEDMDGAVPSSVELYYDWSEDESDESSEEEEQDGWKV